MPRACVAEDTCRRRNRWRGRRPVLADQLEWSTRTVSSFEASAVRTCPRPAVVRESGSSVSNQLTRGYLA